MITGQKLFRLAKIKRNAICLAAIFLLLPGITAIDVYGKAGVNPALQDVTETPENTPITDSESPPAAQQTATASPTVTPTATPTPVNSPLPSQAVEEANLVAAPGSAIIIGNITFQGYPPPPDPRYAADLQLSLMVPNDPSSLEQFQVTTDEDGNFIQENIPPGTYHVQIKHANHIPSLKWNIALAEGENLLNFSALKAGDANNDGYVSATDFSILSASYGKCNTDPGFDSRPDFNQDNCITAVDFSLLSSSYGQGGTINPLPTSTPFPTPTPTSTPSVTPTSSIPPSAAISNITGTNQALPLNCESSSAVDWAGYYGVYLNDVTFHFELPVSDNPDFGFVGNVYGVWGQIPPNPYGVHADPIAANLRNHGLKAAAVKNLSYASLQSQIASGNPVIVWVIGHVWAGTPVNYTDSLGRSTTVARYEHTVMVIGYSPTSVTILDGNSVYQRSLTSFLDSWGVLNNMAVIYSN